MSKKLLFAAIASILATGAYATSATVTSKDYVDNTFQTKIPANSFTAFGEGMPSLLSTTDTDGVTGEIGLVTTSVSGIEAPDYYSYNEVFDSAVPSFAQVQLMIYRDIENAQDSRQTRIAPSGYYTNSGLDLYTYSTGNGNLPSDWLHSSVKGTGLVTKTSNPDKVGERKIFEATDVSGYHASGLTQNEKDIQDISIPTVGAMMTAISNNQVTLPTGTPGNVVTYNAQGNIGGSVATYDGSGTYNAGTDAGKIATAAAVNTRQAKKTCAGWPDGVEHTDANCWLWNMPD